MSVAALSALTTLTAVARRRRHVAAVHRDAFAISAFITAAIRNAAAVAAAVNGAAVATIAAAVARRNVAAAVAHAVAAAVTAAMAAMTASAQTREQAPATTVASAGATAIASVAGAVAIAITTMAGNGRGFTAHEGDADNREKDRDTEKNSSIHPKLLEVAQSTVKGSEHVDAVLNLTPRV